MLMASDALFRDSSQLKPGFYEDVREDVYHLWDLPSNSRLTRLRDYSPAHVKYDIDNPELAVSGDPLKYGARVLGSAIHYAILQPSLFPVRYAGFPDRYNRSTKEGKEAFARFSAENRGKTFLYESDVDVCSSVTSSVWANLDARALLESEGRAEVSAVFDDPETGLRCKARIDFLSEEYQATVDIKSCACAHPRVFERDIFNNGYHRQGLFYKTAANALGVPVLWHVIIAVEKEPPYACVVYRLNEAALQLAAQELTNLKLTYKQCVQTGIWPAYSDGLVSIGVPEWALRQGNIV